MKMSEIMNKLMLYFQYPFVRYAMVVGVLIALCSSLLGVTLVLKRFSFIGDDLSHVAFGAMAIASILTLTSSQVKLCCILSVIVVIVFVLFYHKIFFVTFDETFVKAIGMKTDFYNLFIAIITAVIIVLAMNLVGLLLISALVIFPALAAMHMFKTFLGVTVCSVICVIIGILMSILAGTSVDPMIVATDIVAFLICCGIGKTVGR